MAESLTPRMAEALEWLRRVGKATPMTLTRHGYSRRTMDALTRRGLATVQDVGSTAYVPCWRPATVTNAVTSDDR